MQINKFSPYISIQRNEFKQQNYKTKVLNKDTISFSARKDDIDLKLIDDRRVLESTNRILSKQKISRGEYINILKFFGFEKEGKRQNKELYERKPYGTKIEVPSDQEVPKAFIVKLCEALKQVNSMNGELYFGSERDKFIELTNNFHTDNNKNRYRHNLELKKTSKTNETTIQQNDELFIKKQSEIEYTKRKQQEAIENEKERQIKERKQKAIDSISVEIRETRSLISSEIKEWNEIKDDIIKIKKDPINFVLFEYVDSVIEEIEKQSDILKEKKQAIREAETMHAQINVESDEDEIKKVESFASQVSYSVLEIIDKSKKAIEEKYLILLTKMSEEEQALSEHNKERFERITEIFNQVKINYEKNLNIPEQIKMDIDISSPSTVEENTITSEITSPEKIQTIQTEQIKTIATTEETRTSEIITQMSRNLTPLANEKAREDVSDLLEKSLSSSDREILANGDFDSSKKLIDSKIEKLIKTNEYRQIVNALLYAFLNTVYENSLEKNSSIYELELRDIKKISSILAYGRTTLNIKDIKLNIPNNIDPKSVEKKYEEFNVPLSDEEIENIKEVLTRYCDDISVDNEVRVEELLKKQSRYLTILLDDSKPEEVKITLIKSFWSLFDSNNDTDLKSEIINNYRQVKLHEEKLKALDDMDSDDFEIDIF